MSLLEFLLSLRQFQPNLLIPDSTVVFGVSGWPRIRRLSRIAISADMAVPKKKTSKSKRDKRRATWRHKAVVEAQKALSLGKSILTGRSTFVYPTAEEEEEES